MPKTLQDSQKLLEISILPNLCRDIDFGKVSRKRPELRQHHEHGDTTLRALTANWIMRNKMPKTLQDSQKLLEISILPNLCKNIDFGEVSRKQPELRQHHEHGDTTPRAFTANWIMRNKMLKTLQDSQKLLEISILPNLCRNIDFGKVSRERRQNCGNTTNKMIPH